jgi:hypothetical protein
VLEGGQLLEKAAANISVVKGTLTAARAQSMSSRGRSSVDPAGGQPYAAAAMSLVFHPAHPMVPTLRADVRLFQVRGEGEGGGRLASRTAARGRGAVHHRPPGPRLPGCRVAAVAGAGHAACLAVLHLPGCAHACACLC